MSLFEFFGDSLAKTLRSRRDHSSVAFAQSTKESTMTFHTHCVNYISNHSKKKYEKNYLKKKQISYKNVIKMRIDVH